VTLHLLFTGLAFGLRQPGVGGPPARLMGVLALGNAVSGMRLMWSLMHGMPNTQDYNMPPMLRTGDLINRLYSIIYLLSKLAMKLHKTIKNRGGHQRSSAGAGAKTPVATPSPPVDLL
jgi:hypothetical protein